MRDSHLNSGNFLALAVCKWNERWRNSNGVSIRKVPYTRQRWTNPENLVIYRSSGFLFFFWYTLLLFAVFIRFVCFHWFFFMHYLQLFIKFAICLVLNANIFEGWCQLFHIQVFQRWERVHLLKQLVSSLMKRAI